MKALHKKVGLALTSLLAVSSGLGVFGSTEPARADDNWYDSVRQKCERVSAGYFCRDSGRIENSSNGRFGQGPYGNRGYRIREGTLYEGAIIPTRTYSNDRIEIEKGNSRSLTLLVDRDIRSDTTNTTLIPEGSRIDGQLRSYDGGIRYEADSITLPNGQRFDLEARSDVIYPNNSRRSNDGALTSSAATIILSTILGRDRDVDPGDVIRGGDIFSRSRSRGDQVVLIDPRDDLDLRLTEDFRIRD